MPFSLDMRLSCRLVKFFISSSLWLLLRCRLSYGTATDIACLRSIKQELVDPHGYLNSSWNFNNDTEGFICSFMEVECWRPDENRVLNLRLTNMGLKGRFPAGFNNCTSITGIDLSSNELFGSLPDDIPLAYVTSLDLSSNNFSGEIPLKLANCTYLNSLKLDHNSFTGQIPPQFGLLTRLKVFSVPVPFPVPVWL